MLKVEDIIIEHKGQPGWWPQHTGDRYFYGESCDHGGPRPNNCADQDDWPELIPGFMPRKLEGQPGWEQVANHIGEEGFINDKPFKIVEYGDYPKGWSTEPPPPTPEEKAEQVRSQRDALITETDYLLMPDYPISPENKQAVQDYRQALRDITAQPDFPDSVVWPEKPGFLI